MAINRYEVDPLSDPRWPELVERHPNASVFHTANWLKTIYCTYGCKPVVFTTSAPGHDLKNGVVFCPINSWLTGRRLVSLPFSDHCESLCDSTESATYLIGSLQSALKCQEWKYLEVRPIDEKFGQICEGIGFLPDALYFLHRLNLRQDLKEVFANLDKDSVRRRIQRAERAGLVEQRGRSDDLLKSFFGLFVATRSRHGLPPMPYAWFQNLIRCLGEALEIRVAFRDKIPIAGILTLRFKDTVYFKYGCSDLRFHRFGATPWLLWNAIEAGKSSGANEFDMGRTEENNAGLLNFKNHWVPQPNKLVYWRFPRVSSLYSINGRNFKIAKRIFSCMPDRLLSLTGSLLYRHIG